MTTQRERSEEELAEYERARFRVLDRIRMRQLEDVAHSEYVTQRSP